ncbi:MAG: PAS domain S-box protein, partial [Solirubrobacterales bacterium]|nr:PAS domain S-box protein [Solirubrobacterales bacterium]
MTAARHSRVRRALSARVAAPLLVVLLSVGGFVLISHAVNADRRTGAERQAALDAQQIQGLLARARTFALGLGNALAGERAPNARRFAALVGTSTTTIGLADAVWVESVGRPGSARYETRFVTGLPQGTDVSALPALASTLQNPTSIFAGTATTEQAVGGQRGFFLVQSAQFGRGPGSTGFLVVFVPAGWLSQSLPEDPQRTAISLDGQPLTGALTGAPAVAKRFEALDLPWRVQAVATPASPLQGTLPLLAIAWPVATALLIYLIGRAILRRRRAEREVDDIYNLSLDLLCTVGVDGFLKRVNPAFRRTLGYEESDLLSRPLLEFVHPDDRTATTTALSTLRARDAEESFASRFIRADGGVRWLEWNMRPLLERSLIYAAAHDVTETRTLTQEQAALRRVATLVAEGPAPRDLFAAVAVEVGQLLGASATRLLRHESDGTVAVVAAHGASDADMGICGTRGGDETEMWARIARGATVIHGENPAGESAPPGGDGRDPAIGAIGAVAAAPIAVSGRPWGMIVVAWKHAEMARRDTETRLEEFTELVATAVANAESRAELAASRRRIGATADETRRRIERDLHDGVQQRLVTSVVTLKNAQQALDDGSENARELVRQALENTESANDELREVARGIMPGILTRGGLGPALRTVARRSPIPVALDLRTDTRLPERTEVTAYFVVSEALANAAKHSGASAVTV